MRGKQDGATARIGTATQMMLENQTAGRIKAIEAFIQHHQCGFADQRQQHAKTQ